MTITQQIRKCSFKPYKPLTPIQQATNQIKNVFKRASERLWRDQSDYCEIGMSSCQCGWRGRYPLSGCPCCSKSFVS